MSASASKDKKKAEPTFRVNTRILESQNAYIKSGVKMSKGKLTEGEFTRQLLALGIAAHKSNK